MNEPNELLDSLREIAARTYRNELGIADILKGQNKIMALLDTEIALVNTIDTNVQNLITEIAALKAANPTVDTSGLDAALNKLQTDVATAGTDAAPATPAPPPVNPVTVPTPAAPTTTGDTSAQ